MKKYWKIIASVLAITLIAVIWILYTPSDLRTPHLKKQISQADYIKGRSLVSQMQEAYGGMDRWMSFKTARYAQTADWYDDKLGIAGWDTLPQRFQMTSTLGTDNAEFTLLNGENTGQIWGVVDGKSYHRKRSGANEFIENKKYQHKLIYKNYWFQFPFRMSEAPIIAYAGERTIKGKVYDLVYATWGSEKPNKQYDQYILYLDPQTKMIEWLNFTVREKLNYFQATAQFADFADINGIISPFSQYITLGKPGGDGLRMHENRYDWIEYGGEKVMRE